MSIFKRIEEMIRMKGELPEDFEAEEREYAENELRFAPGAMEGILGHHSAGKGEKSEFVEKLKKYLQMSPDEAMHKFEEEEAPNFHTASMRQGLLTEIIEHKEEYDAGKVANLAYCFAGNGTKCETVKLGLSLLALFNFSGNEKVCHLLQTLGYYEEFTDYVLMNVSDWEEAKQQEFYFELAKKLKGWGKINVVEMLQADTEEKKQWILCHGCKNTVMYSYLGLECAKKGELFARLQKGSLTIEELKGACDIMEGLIDEGPCQGMSVIEHPVELTLCYLEELKNYFTGSEQMADITYVAQLNRIKAYFEESELEGAASVGEKVQEVKGALDIDRLIAYNLKEKTHDCLQVARLYNVDLASQILELMEEDFSKYYTFAYFFLANNKCIEEFFELCDREIDSEKYPNKMGNSLGLGKLGDGILMLDLIVQYLDKYPLKGKKLIEISIKSPIVRWRNMAARALHGWVEKLNQSLAEIDADLYAMVKDVAAVECNESLKEQWEKLI